MTDPLLSLRLAGNVRAVLRPVLLTTMLGLVVVLASVSTEVSRFEVMAPVILILATAAALYLMSTGRVSAAAHCYVGALLVTGVVAVAGYGSIRSVSNLTFVGAVVVAGVFLGRRALVGTMVLSSAAIGALVYAERSGVMAARDRPVGWIQWLVLSVGTVLIGLVVHYSRVVAFEAHERQQEELAERKRAEATIRLTEERLRLSMDASRQGWFDIDVPTGTVVVSEQFAQLAAVDPARPERDLRKWFDRVHEADRASVITAFEECLASGETRQADYRLRTRTGEWIWIRSIAKVVEWDEEHRPLRVTGTHADISDRVLATEALRDSEVRYRTLFEQAGDYILLLEIVPHGPPVIRDVNLAAVKALGYSRAELIGSPVAMLEPGVSSETIDQRRSGVSANGSMTFEARHQRKDGSTFDAEVRGTEFMMQGKRMAIASERDVSYRKLAEAERSGLEAELRQAQKMESVGRLAGGVAHDFNNMLGVIIGVAELAMLELDPGHPLRAQLEEIHDAARHSADLTRQLLTFARKQAVAPTVLDLNETVARSTRMLERLIGENVSLEWHPGDGLWRIYMDASQLEQILANLCVNAKDAIEDVGTLRIATENCVIGELFATTHADAAPGEYVRLTVSDTGHGMSGEVVAQIFEPFFTTKGVGQGTGLGLSTVYGAVRQNRGFITVSSVVGEGTTFEIYLPRHVGRADAGQAAGPEPPSGRGRETILLVEDEVTLLRLATRALERSGYAVLTANSPAKALALASAHPGKIDLLLTDVVMPGMNGQSLATAVRAQRPGIAWLFMSGFAADFNGGEWTSDDASRFIAKPFTVAALTAKVREVLDRA